MNTTKLHYDALSNCCRFTCIRSAQQRLPYQATYPPCQLVVQRVGAGSGRNLRNGGQCLP